MKQELPAAAALQVITELLRRTPMSVAEQIGAQAAIDRLEELTLPKPPAPDALPPNPTR